MGDNADMAMIEFVDFNELYTKSDKPKRNLLGEEEVNQTKKRGNFGC